MKSKISEDSRLLSETYTHYPEDVNDFAGIQGHTIIGPSFIQENQTT